MYDFTYELQHCGEPSTLVQTDVNIGHWATIPMLWAISARQ